MNAGNKDRAARFSRYTTLLMVVWSAFMGGFYLHEGERTEEQTRGLAISQARAYAEKDFAFRSWAASHGAVYVPASETTPPDPYLASIPERDVTTPSGKRLTMINPATMLRQISERYAGATGVPGRVTSLHPLRPENSPDAWERRALERLAAGEAEIFSFTEENGEQSLRHMRPAVMASDCVACHVSQGFKPGDIGGGISVRLNMKDFLSVQSNNMIRAATGSVVVWALGMLALYYGGRRFAWHERNQRYAMRALEEEQTRKSAYLDSALDAIISIDQDGRVLDFNPAAERIFGYKSEQVVGQYMVEKLIPSLNWIRQQPDSDLIDSGRRLETLGIYADGREFPLELALTRVVVAGQPVCTAFVRDITEARALADQLSYQASHDSLTGLVNRREFELRLSHALEDLEPGREHALFYIDLDRFKIVNDTCGHAAGDELLRQIAHLLEAEVRAADTVGRLGGDEFGVLLRSCSLEKAKSIGNAILEAIKAHHFVWAGHSFTLGASIGVVPLIPDHTHISDLLCTVDAACYRAKEDGRNRMVVYQPDDADLEERRGEMRWISRIHDAFEQQRFILYAQEILSLKRAANCGGEAYEILLRLKDEKGNMVPPGMFLSVAERYDLMPTIDRWVVRNVLKWLHEHPQSQERLEFCTINLSAHSLADGYFLEFIKDRFREYDVQPGRICFELTETAAVTNLTKASAFILALKELGCRFALDDFGSGMSSFGYLKNLPVDILKIDGEFVRDIVIDPIDRAMVKSINEIGQVMGKQTIAEFVEDDDVKEALRSMGVDYAQGYGISAPCPLEKYAVTHSEDQRQFGAGSL